MLVFSSIDPNSDSKIKKRLDHKQSGILINRTVFNAALTSENRLPYEKNPKKMKSEESRLFLESESSAAEQEPSGTSVASSGCSIRTETFAHNDDEKSFDEFDQGIAPIVFTNNEAHFAKPACSVASTIETYPARIPGTDSKYDQTAIIGFYADENESQEEKEYIDYGCKRLMQKFQQENHPAFSAIYNLEGDPPSLSGLTENSRVILIGHSRKNCLGETLFSGKEHDHVAEILLEDCDFSRAKTLKFVSCKLGNSDFLSDLRADLVDKVKAMPILVGYSKPLKMSFFGSLCVDLGEDEGIVSARPYRVCV